MSWALEPSSMYDDRFVNGMLLATHTGADDETTEEATERILDLMVEESRPVVFLCGGSAESRIELALSLLKRTANVQMKVGKKPYVIGVGLDVFEAPSGETLKALGARCFLRIKAPLFSAPLVRLAGQIGNSPVGLIVAVESASPLQLVVYRRKLERVSPSRGRAVVVGR